MAVETIEHWWNGCWGRMSRRDLWLRYDDGKRWWRLEWSSAELQDHRIYVEEANARETMATLLTPEEAAPGAWKRTDPAALGTSSPGEPDPDLRKIPQDD